MSCVSSRQMASPSPLPPKRRLVDSSAWVNGSKILPMVAASIPMPVSPTEISTLARSAVVAARTSARTSTSPRAVNLTALPIRFIRICRTRSASPRSEQCSGGGGETMSSMPFAWAAPAKRLEHSSRTWPRSKGRSSSAILPALIFDRSSRSLTICSSTRAEERMVSVRRDWVEESGVRARSSVMPTTPFMGVRSSWLMRSRKSLFARTASASWRLLSVSSRVRSLTSDSRRWRASRTCWNLSRCSRTR